MRISLVIRPAILLALAGCGGPGDPGPRAEGEECDVVAQDCAAGLRCSPRHDELAVPVYWAIAEFPAPVSPAVCVPLQGESAVGEPCEADPEAGTDDCAAGGFCFTTDEDRTAGVCAALCNAAVPDCGEVGLPDLACFGSHAQAPGMCFQAAESFGDPSCPEGTTPTFWYDFPYDVAIGCMPVGEQAPGEACAPARCEAGSGCLDGACYAYCTVETAGECPSGYCAVWAEPMNPYGICWDMVEEQ